jgi:hypothetical protein
VGQFRGKLAGPYTSIIGANDINSTVSFSIDSAGAVTGTYAGPNGSKATLAGSVDCASGELSVRIEKGTYSLAPFPAVVSFSGTLTGRYNPTTRTFTNGAWKITESASATNGGSGTWTQQ